MTINPFVPQKLTDEVTFSNVETLRRLKPGEKLRVENHRLIKEQRYFMVGVRRAVGKAFSPETISSTLYTYKMIIGKVEEDAKLNQDEASKSLVKKISKMKESIWPAVKKIKELAITYTEEAKNCYNPFAKEQKLATAKTLKEIYRAHKYLKPKTSLQDFRPREKNNKAPSQETEEFSNFIRYHSPATRAHEADNEVEIPKLNDPQKRITTILHNLAECKLKEAKRKFNKPYVEKSKLKSFVKKKSAGKSASLQSELSSIFSNNLPSMKNAYSCFENDLKKKKKFALSKGEDDSFLKKFNVKMLEQKKEGPEDRMSQMSFDDVWSDDFEREYNRNIVIQNAGKRPLTRSISVYPSYERLKQSTITDKEIKPYTFDAETLDIFARRRTFTQYSTTEGELSDDEYSDGVFESDEDFSLNS